MRQVFHFTRRLSFYTIKYFTLNKISCLQDLIELALQLQTQVTEKNKRLTDLEDYIDALLLRVIECSPRLLQNPYQRRLSSPGNQ